MRVCPDPVELKNTTAPSNEKKKMKRIEIRRSSSTPMIYNKKYFSSEIVLRSMQSHLSSS